MAEPCFKLEKGEIAQVANAVRPIFDDHANQYDFEKYPADALRGIRATFSTGRIDAEAVSIALKWKWGHWSKPNIPEAHKSLIRVAQNLCSKFNDRPSAPDPRQTFEFWAAELGSRRRYITRSFLTHLQHPQEIAIIDQHNWRAMRRLLEGNPRARQLPAAPSSYLDLLTLSAFCRSLTSALRADADAVDHFLMQFGKSIKKRSRLTTCRRWRSAPRPSPHLR
jgi:hypothetical protein